MEKIVNKFEGRNYCIVTYGCQMNVHESEKIRGELTSLGMIETEDVNKAMVVVFNTCCVREGAEDRAYNNIIALQNLKAENPDLIIVVCGCMPQQRKGKYNLWEKLPFVDIILGTYNISELSEYLLQFAKKKHRIMEILDKPRKDMDVENAVRDDKINASSSVPSQA